MPGSREQGLAFERQAAAYLETKGLTILERNWRCPGGEIDLIARHGEVLVFVEVRARSSMTFGGALASIDHRKRRRIVNSAERYLQGLGCTPPCRFDVVAIGAGGQIEWLMAAFSAEDG